MTYALGQGTGPLRGVRVVEIAGIGPGPHAATLLADLGADVIRVERPGGATSPGTRGTDLLTRGRPSVALDLKRPEAVATVLRPGRDGRRAARGDAARRHRAARPRPRRLPGPQPAPGLRPDDRLGPGRAARAHGRARHQLHRGGRRAARPRPGRRPPALPDQPARRLRWRVDVPRHRGARRPARGAGRAGRGRSSTPRSWTARRTCRRCTRACWPAASPRSGGPRTCSTAARRSTTSTRPPTAGTCRVGALEPQFYAVLVELLGLARRCPTATTRPAGRRSGRRSPGGSRSARRPSGPRCSTAPTPASRRCCR